MVIQINSYSYTILDVALIIDIDENNNFVNSEHLHSFMSANKSF
jgi:hypothetical protein